MEIYIYAVQKKEIQKFVILIQMIFFRRFRISKKTGKKIFTEYYLNPQIVINALYQSDITCEEVNL